MPHCVSIRFSIDAQTFKTSRSLTIAYPAIVGTCVGHRRFDHRELIASHLVNTVTAVRATTRNASALDGRDQPRESFSPEMRHVSENKHRTLPHGEQDGTRSCWIGSPSPPSERSSESVHRLTRTQPERAAR